MGGEDKRGMENSGMKKPRQMMRERRVSVCARVVEKTKGMEWDEEKEADDTREQVHWDKGVCVCAHELAEKTKGLE